MVAATGRRRSTTRAGTAGEPVLPRRPESADTAGSSRTSRPGWSSRDLLHLECQVHRARRVRRRDVLAALRQPINAHTLGVKAEGPSIRREGAKRAIIGPAVVDDPSLRRRQVWLVA